MAVPYIVPKMTYADLAGWPDDGKRYEIIDGDLYMSPAPSRWRQRLVGRFHLLLHDAVEITGWGEVYVGPLDVLFTDDNYFQPDLVVIRKDRLSIFRDNQRFEGPPDIVIEVVSPSNPSYDEIKKADLYAAFGVLEYWLANPLTRRFRLLKLETGRYVEVHPVDGVYHSTAVPGLIVDPVTLFANLD